MSRKVLVSMLLVGTLAIASVAGVVIYRSANAAASVPILRTSNDRGLGGPGRGFDNGAPKGGASDEELASALGITVAELQAAYQKANDAALAQAVTEGLITQAQADQIKSNGQAFPFGGRWMGWLKQQGIDYETLLAEALGITTEKLQTAYTQAFNTRLDQAVTDGKLTQDQADLMKGQRALSASESFKSAMQTAFEAAIKQAVSGGVITQAQADLILQAANQKGDGMGMDVPFMGGDGHGRGGFGGGPGFGPDNGGQPANPAPSAPGTSPSSGGL
jgi:hypothetical protein